MLIKEKKNLFRNLPEKTGVYIFKGKDGQPLYVGKALNLKRRISSHLKPQMIVSHLGERAQKLIEETEALEYFLVESEVEALLLEAKLIKKFKPHFNHQLKDDKSFLYIKITKDDFPKVTPGRLPKDKKLRSKLERENYYFGPFTSARTVRKTLKALRFIFPFCSAKKIPSKPCFYYGIGLCIGPCGGYVGKKEYQKMIRGLRLLLQGKKSQLIKKLIREMSQQSELKNYEQAAKIRDQIEKIKFLTSHYRLPEEYLKNPNLYEDQRRDELRELKKQLLPYFGNLKDLRKIEAFDISNLRGKAATGSMIVFIAGEPSKKDYRRFKIRTQKTPNDPQMLKEVLSRRLNHDWELPDLILVDGGKSQLSAGLEILKEKKVRVPIIGLAKREEKIILKKNEVFKILSLAKTSPGLKLVQRIRDESHRFAITYHRKLRAKKLFDKN